MTNAKAVPDWVWYASYGSNMRLSRFMRYLAGDDERVPEAQRHYPARNPHPPTASRPWSLPATLYFAGDSRTWGGGGVLFLRPISTPVGGDSPGVQPVDVAGRAYRITGEQFCDVMAQENDRPQGDTLEPDFAALIRDGSLDLSPLVGTGWYNTLLLCGDNDGEPVLTFTRNPSAASARPLPLAEPSDAYLAQILLGLNETYAWTAEQMADYVQTVSSGQVSRQRVLAHAATLGRPGEPGA